MQRKISKTKTNTVTMYGREHRGYCPPPPPPTDCFGTGKRNDYTHWGYRP